MIIPTLTKLIVANTNNIKQISCVFFKMDNPYRDFSKYEKHLQNFCSYVNKLQNHDICIYVDDSTKDNEIVKSMTEQYNNINIIYYNCEEYKHNGFHNGVFGTLIRFYSLFINDERYKYQWISDVDMTQNYFTTNEEEMMDKNNVDFCFMRYIHYFTQWVNPSMPASIIGNFIISKITFDRSLLDNYIDELYHAFYKNKDGSLNDMIKKLQTKTQYKYKSENKELPYGIDELFLNYYVFPYVIKNKIRYGMRTELFGSAFTRYARAFGKPNKQEYRIAKELLKREEELYYNEYKDKDKLKKYVEDLDIFLHKFKNKIDDEFDYGLKKFDKHKEQFKSSHNIFTIGKLKSRI
uniref:Uncharacterized protein n=1 Tax=viral metagenome TaxID=1070528 RepID=A0A6C0EB58_9ZZZZ